MNAIAGRTETAALGAALATDWVSTSGIERTFLRSPAAPPGEDVGLTDPVGLTTSAISLPPLVPVVVNVVRRVRGRYVQCRVPVEEAMRQEVKPDVLHGHHWPLLGAHCVMRTHGVPEDHVLVLQLAVALDELRQTGASRVLVRVVARGEHLIGVVLGDPEVLGRELRSLNRERVGLIEREHV